MIDNRSDVIRLLKRYCEGKDKIDVAKVSVLNIHRMIKALEQEPCEDAISREATVTCIRSNLSYICTGDKSQAIRDVQNMPPVTPQQRWIPVTKRQPKKSGKYWCTFGGTNLTGSDYYTTESDAKETYEEPEEYVGWASQNVIAWMPSPEPYEAEER